MKIITAKSAGFCAGVKRAVDMTFAEAERAEGRLVVLGELVHNPLVSEQLAQAGVATVGSIDELPSGCRAVIRAHGVPPQTYSTLEERGITYLDTTCPLVKRVQDIVAAQNEETILLLMGDSAHPEVIGIAGNAKGKVIILKTADELENTVRNMEDNSKKVFVLASQTTFMVDEWNKCTEIAKKVCTNLKIFDTICKATVLRQQEAEELSHSVDAMIVIGGRNSSNTCKLYNIAAANCKTVFLEKAAELGSYETMLAMQPIVGITAGASTPACIIKEVQESMSRLDNISNEMSFEEMLEQSFKSTYNG
ncbi:MAG: 4-hydroxy-3-methylbut-2-enyl diphosphate reductase, partial [Angelakisella sp.]